MLFKAQVWFLRKTVGISPNRLKETLDFPLRFFVPNLGDPRSWLVAHPHPHHYSLSWPGCQFPVLRGLRANLGYSSFWIWGVIRNILQQASAVNSTHVRLQNIHVEKRTAEPGGSVLLGHCRLRGLLASSRLTCFNVVDCLHRR